MFPAWFAPCLFCNAERTQAGNLHFEKNAEFATAHAKRWHMRCAIHYGLPAHGKEMRK